MAKLKINGKSYFVGNEPDTPLLWVLREDLKLTGTKFGCGGVLLGHGREGNRLSSMMLKSNVA